MEDAFLSDLSGGYYYDAFSTYADMCDNYISGVQSGYYEEGEAYEESTVGDFPWARRFWFRLPSASLRRSL